MNIKSFDSIKKVLNEGTLAEILKANCPECGKPLEIEYSNAYGGVYSAICSCLKFGIKADGMEPPPWVNEIGEEYRIRDLPVGDEFRIRIENHKLLSKA